MREIWFSCYTGNHARLISSPPHACPCAKATIAVQRTFLISALRNGLAEPLSSSGPLIPGYVRRFQSSLGTDDRFTTRPCSADKQHGRRYSYYCCIEALAVRLRVCSMKKNRVSLRSGRGAADSVCFRFVRKRKTTPTTTTEFAQSAGPYVSFHTRFRVRRIVQRVVSHCTRVPLRTPD